MCRQADLSKLPDDKTGHPISQPSVLTHVDFTDSSAPRTLERYFGADTAAELQKKPWAIIQVRPLLVYCHALVCLFLCHHLLKQQFCPVMYAL